MSADGLAYRWLGETPPVGTAVARYQARLSCVLRSGPAFVGLYDGASSADEDTEERLGAAISFEVYYEYARADGSHELRLTRVPCT